MTQYVKLPDGRTFGPFLSKPHARATLSAKLGRERLPRGTTWSTVPFPGQAATPSVIEAVVIEAVSGTPAPVAVRALASCPVTPSDLSDVMADLSGWALLEAVMASTLARWEADPTVTLPNVLLEGPPGTGKTFSAANYWLPAGRPAIRCQLHDDSDAAATGGGHWALREQSFTWLNGHCARAWLGGTRLVLDEIGRANGAVLDALLQFLERPESAQATLDNGELIRPAPGFHCIATTNGTAADLDPALQDRFTLKIAITEPHPAAIEALPADLRDAAIGRTTGGIQTTLRAWRNFAELRQSAGNAVAARAIFGTSAADLLHALALGAESDK